MKKLIVSVLVFVVLAVAGQAQAQSATMFVCRVTGVSSATECQALTAGKSIKVTDVILTNNVATAQTIKLVTGTGTNCATGTADLTAAAYFGANLWGNLSHSFHTPLVAPVGAAVCVTPSAATSVSATLVGFIE
jgi:hypothetical protein